MEERIKRAVDWLLGPEVPSENAPGHLWGRWIFLRALGIFYFSAFYSLLFQIRGLIGPDGILPARDYLQAVSGALHSFRFWYAPTLFWCLLQKAGGLAAPAEILPARDYLQAVSGALHSFRFWYAPTLFWFGSSDHALMLACCVGVRGSLLG